MKKVDYDKEDRQAIKLRRTRKKQIVRDRQEKEVDQKQEDMKQIYIKFWRQEEDSLLLERWGN